MMEHLTRAEARLCDAKIPSGTAVKWLAVTTLLGVVAGVIFVYDGLSGAGLRQIATGLMGIGYFLLFFAHMRFRRSALSLISKLNGASQQ